MFRSLLAELRRRHVYRVAAAYAVVGWLLMQLAATVFPAFDAPPWVLRVVIGVIVIGFPVAVVLAWAFEVTPEGVRRTEAAGAKPGDDDGEPRPGRRTRDGLVVTLVVIVIAIVAGQRWWPRAPASHAARPAPVASAGTTGPGATDAPSTAIASSSPAIPVPAKSIAVLPFANLSGDKSQDYFSDGISEDLLNLLARIPQLQVTARTSSFWFRGKDFTIPQIAEKLRVAYVLEGSVQKAGDQVRISVQLVDAASDTQRWSQTYDRPFRDVFKIQDEIGADVVKHLKLRLLGDEPKARALDSRAYKLYLQARYIENRGNLKAYHTAAALLRQSLAIDPNNAPAWIAMAWNIDAQMSLVKTSPSAIKAEEEQMLEYARKALAINPDSGRAQTLLARLSHDRQTAARHMQRALASEPNNPDVLISVSIFLFRTGHPEQSLLALRRAQSRDQFNTTIYAAMVAPLMQEGRYREALEAAQRALEISPDRAGAHESVAWAYLAEGHPHAALLAFNKEVNPISRMAIEPSLYCHLGRKADAMRLLHAMETKGAGVSPTFIATGYIDCGDPDRAFQWLARIDEKDEGPLPYLVFGFSFRHYHDDPRWKAFLRRTGYAPEQLAKIRFDMSPLEASP